MAIVRRNIVTIDGKECMLKIAMIMISNIDTVNIFCFWVGKKQKRIVIVHGKEEKISIDCNEKGSKK